MPTATLRWGLAIPANKFDALLHCFERHDPNYINPGTGAETISERLQKYLLAATEGPESFSAFYVEVSPYEIKVTHPRSTKHVQRWGINAWGTSILPLGPELSDARPSSNSLRKLERDLHLEEAGIEVPVKGRWFLSVGP